MIPEHLIDFTWRYVLIPQANEIKNPLRVNEQISLNLFIYYFSSSCLFSKVFPLSVWNHFTNDGPRTTNYAEGYHCALNKCHIKEMHASLEILLTKLQSMHNEQGTKFSYGNWYKTLISRRNVKKSMKTFIKKFFQQKRHSNVEQCTFGQKLQIYVSRI